MSAKKKKYIPIIYTKGQYRTHFTLVIAYGQYIQSYLFKNKEINKNITIMTFLTQQ